MGAREIAIATAALVAAMVMVPAAPAVVAADWPHATFRFRCRASATGSGSLSSSPSSPSSQEVPQRYQFAISTAASRVEASAAEWSGWGNFTRADAARAKAAFPGWPILLATLHVSAVSELVSGSTHGVNGSTAHRRMSSPPLTAVDVEMVREGGTQLHARLFGSELGIMLTEVDQPSGPVFWTVRQFNRWKYFDHFGNASTPPVRFPAVGRFIGSSDDVDEWGDGIAALLRTGFSGVALPATKPLGSVLSPRVARCDGCPRAGAGPGAPAPARPMWAAGIYAPPGGAFDFDCGATDDDVAWVLANWANKTAAAYSAAGFELGSSTTFALADEPGWYFPSVTAAWPNRTHQAWREYLVAQGFSPAALGAADWAGVTPLGRSGATTVPLRRRFYWTVRFLSVLSSRHMAAVTRAAEAQFYYGMLMFANWNNDHGRLWVPGPLGNNKDKGSLDAGYGSHDWYVIVSALHCAMGGKPTLCGWTAC